MVSNANSWVWLAVVVLIALLRYVSRWLQLGTPKNFQIEDLLMIVNVILYVLLTVYLIEVEKYGTNGIPLDKVDQIKPSAIPDLIKGSKLVIVVEQLWLGVIWGCKACLLLLYSTMTSGLSQHRIVKLIGAFCALSFVLVEILFFAAWCHPFSAYWSVPPKNIQCSVYRNHLILVLALNIATDLMIMCIPLPLLIKAKLSLTKKITLCAVFSLGIFVILCSILSKYYSISNPYGDRWVDWYVREAATAIVVANIPQTWTLFRRMFNWKSFLAHSSYNRSHSRSKYTNRLDSSTIHLSRFKGGDKSHTRSVDITASGEHINPDQPLEIWEHREDHCDDTTVIRFLRDVYLFHVVTLRFIRYTRSSSRLAERYNMPGLAFNPDNDIPDLSGKVIFITGGTAGLGAQSVAQLAKHSPARIYISGRNATSAETIIKGIAEAGSNTPVSFVECDLTSLDSVKRAADEIIAKESRLDMLMCNAGIMALPPGLTKDGYEVQFGTNHLGHALLIQKLLPLLQRTAERDADVRVIILTSKGYQLHPYGGIIFDDLKTTQDYGFLGSWRRYGQSKLANILYTRELARRYPAITVVSVHPGVITTSLVENLGWAHRWFIYATTYNQMVTLEKGAYNQLWAATTSKDGLETGQYYIPVGVASNDKLTKTGRDDVLAGQLWEWTDKALEDYL
ncbi:hypothetical protein BDV30DRAFT_223692 [Aspergillus minisclerotigenes]|uniref:Rhodopsin domain-containing protein n=1 Tax=Aspergillus minisclerotigenes TaxID=656917 RepID=A0A5N6JGY0_9EURO|nr:hypothetical protein BDV30DRAFT_223692 [Aspergillus minisclerotigenes]